MITSFDTIIDIAKNSQPKKVVVAAAEGESVLQAVQLAYKEKLIQPILVGDKQKISLLAKKIKFDLSAIEIYPEKTLAGSAKKAVALIKENKAEILMKGLINTGIILKAVLNKEVGLPVSPILSHITVIEAPAYHKLFVITDGGVIPDPTLNDKAGIIKNAVHFFHKLGVTNPKVAIASAAETVNLKMHSSVDAALLAIMNKRHQIEDCIVDGPLALDNIVSSDACRQKGIDTEVGGDADIIVVPTIESGNMLLKSIKYFGNARMGGVVLGTPVPIILSSRADPPEMEYLSIVSAIAMCKQSK
ncbi:MAG: bifunctional enoyl-CoA hydratase/phosphate acetyltransferase [Gammaproteobacteria bacterium]|nr:bifunctional enoyl-CoA hydratase/phosphate acetyltransferase [Gammaproteobacteria bacterium]